MLIIFTNSEDATANHLELALKRSNVTYFRLNTDTLLHQASFSYQSLSPKLRVGQVVLNPSEISSVWYRRPERIKSIAAPGNEVENNYALDEWSEALEGFFAHIPTSKWMNHPSANSMASHKIEQLSTASKHGFTIPLTLVTQDPNELKEFFFSCDQKVIAKPISQGLLEDADGESISLIYTNSVKPEHLHDLSDLAFCPTLFQRQIDKDFDVRITVIDSDVHAIKLVASENGVQRCDIRRNNMEDVVYEAITLPDDIHEKILSLTAGYGLRFAAIDMAVTKDGEWVYFEINPNGQWAWLDICGGFDISNSFVKSFIRSSS